VVEAVSAEAVSAGARRGSGHARFPTHRRRSRRGTRTCAVLAPLVVLGTVVLTGTGQAAEAGLVAGTPCTRTAEACVDLDEGEAWLIRDGAVTDGPVPISSGAEGEDTPVGAFRVNWKDVNHVSGESGAPMPYSVFFAPGGIAFHEGDIDDESGGCVRLEYRDAKMFFDTLRVGDDVEIH